MIALVDAELAFTPAELAELEAGRARVYRGRVIPVIRGGANVLYDSAKKAFLDADIDLLADDIRLIGIDTADETFNSADDFLNDITSAGRVFVSGALASKTTTAGTFDHADPTINAVTGDTVEAVVYYKHTGTETTSNLICWIDSSPAINFTPNGSNVTVQVDALGVFSI